MAMIKHQIPHRIIATLYIIWKINLFLFSPKSIVYFKLHKVSKAFV
jgi:hypothetical protein